MLWALVVLAAIPELLGDLGLKLWAETDRWLSFGLGLFAYGIALVLFALLLRRAKLAGIFSPWVGMAAILLALTGWWLFGESLSARQVAGLACLPRRRVVGGIFLLGAR
jgi:small multidrug resistance pump